MGAYFWGLAAKTAENGQILRNDSIEKGRNSWSLPYFQTFGEIWFNVDFWVCCQTWPNSMITLSLGRSRYAKIVLNPKNQYHTSSVAANTLNVYPSQGTMYYTWFPAATTIIVGILLLHDTQSVCANALCLYLGDCNIYRLKSFIRRNTKLFACCLSHSIWSVMKSLCQWITWTTKSILLIQPKLFSHVASKIPGPLLVHNT